MTIIDQLAAYFRERPSEVFTPGEIGRAFPKVPDSTIRPMITKLTQRGILLKIGHGRYALSGPEARMNARADLCRRVRALLVKRGRMSLRQISAEMTIDVVEMELVWDILRESKTARDASESSLTFVMDTVIEPCVEDILADYWERHE